MPYTLKTSQISVKDPETGEYSGVDILAEQTEEGLIAELQAEGTTQVNRINQAAVDVQAAVDQAESDAATIISSTQTSINTLEAQKNTIAQTVASMAELGTDTTLSTPGMAADAATVGGLKNALNGNITRANLSDTYQSDQIDILTSADDLDNCLIPNVYRAGVGTQHAPTSNMNYHVIVFESKWQGNNRKAITQIAVSAANSQKLYVRTATTSGSAASWDNSGNWTQINFDISNIDTGAITRSMLSNFYEGHLAFMSSGADLNTVTTACNILVNADVTNSPDPVRRWLVFTQAVPWTTDNNPRYNLVQRAYRADMPAEQYYRIYDSGLSVKWSSWESLTEHIKAAADPVGLTGKKIVLMGDSTYAITGATGKHVANYLSAIGSCTVFDCSFGGTRMSDCRDEQAGGTSADTYKYFDFPRLVDAIIANDFSDQDANLSGKAVEYTTNLATLKTVDFSTIDYLCIEYGANDFTGNVPLGADSSDRTTLRGALIYCVDALMTEYPNLIILVDGMRYRAWLDGTTFIDDVFTHKNTLNLSTLEYISAIKEQSALFGLPFFENLKHYGWNKYNRLTYFPASDGAHYNVEGTKYAAKSLCANMSRIGKSQSFE